MTDQELSLVTDRELSPVTHRRNHHSKEAGPPLDLTSLTDEQFRLWLDGYSNGYMNGLEVGGDIRDAEWDARLLRAAKIVHAAASWPSHARRPRSKSGLEDGGPAPPSSPWPLEIEVQEEGSTDG